jgi:MerR family transcriptional regulator, heat shock protein HspR
MNDPHVTHIVFQQYRSLYNERETAAACHVGMAALRYLHAHGLIEGQEVDGKLHYSEEDIIQVRRIRRLQHDLGINLAGVEVILHLLKRLEAARQEVE